ncbi:hypothetical protein K5X82_08430 [Halosquirtibacter xylanolyticus]|uniref:hypothetical protein n=1 Tax=Halosquirtibacter xylanolyticus TaxID=3374599 RepID=UPI00374A330C|nr:hypothetical protein K5X82_08430 [Prolixibacteraceae bacterium]
MLKNAALFIVMLMAHFGYAQDFAGHYTWKSEDGTDKFTLDLKKTSDTTFEGCHYASVFNGECKDASFNKKDITVKGKVKGDTLVIQIEGRYTVGAKAKVYLTPTDKKGMYLWRVATLAKGMYHYPDYAMLKK